MSRTAMRAAHLAFAGVGAEIAFAVYAWLADPPSEAFGVVAHLVAVAVLVFIGLLGLVPAALLLRPATARRGRWIALGLGIALCLLVFWLPEGILLLAAFGWATWKERGGEPQPPAKIRP